MEKICCDKALTDKTIYWNPFNEVVQCHHCGHSYLPVTIGVDLSKGNDYTITYEKR